MTSYLWVIATPSSSRRYQSKAPLEPPPLLGREGVWTMGDLLSRLKSMFSISIQYRTSRGRRCPRSRFGIGDSLGEAKDCFAAALFFHFQSIRKLVIHVITSHWEVSRTCQACSNAYAQSQLCKRAHISRGRPNAKISLNWRQDSPNPARNNPGE